MAKDNISITFHPLSLCPTSHATDGVFPQKILGCRSSHLCSLSSSSAPKQASRDTEELRSLVARLAYQQSQESTSTSRILRTVSQDHCYKETTRVHDETSESRSQEDMEIHNSFSGVEQENETLSMTRRRQRGRSNSDCIDYLLPQRSECQSCGYQYKGISANPPEITKRGITRGNTAQIHRKAWLEVSDPKHRYGKHLRIYYSHWESLGSPSNDFFSWLDSKPLPNVEACPREVLDNDTVLYITDPDVTSRYALKLVACEKSGRCRVLDRQGRPVRTDLDGWMFVLRDGTFYGARKVNGSSDGPQQRFHHSSFFGGKAVSAAGIFLTDNEGFIVRLFPHSGHYRPGEADMQRILLFLHNLGVDLATFQVDIQQLIRISRHEIKISTKTSQEGDKKRKVESLQLESAELVAHYLSHKARFIGDGILSQIQATSSYS